MYLYSLGLGPRLFKSTEREQNTRRVHIYYLWVVG